jgi:hypothetical protein
METADPDSDSYLTVEQKIRRGELGLSELEHWLEVLLAQEKITSTEQQALLELAWGLSIQSQPPA